MAKYVYEKTNYCIIGHYSAWKKYRITSRLEVTGYKVEGVPEIGVSKRGGWWYIDHLTTGLGVVTVGSKTRDEAVDVYVRDYAARIAGIDLRKAREEYMAAPLESDAEKWEAVHYSTTRGRRYDRLCTAARRAGLIVRKADDGKAIDIIGSPDKLEEIRTMIANWQARDIANPWPIEFLPPACIPAPQLPAVVASAADASIDTTTSAADSAADKEDTMVTYERDAIVCKGVTFEATYNISVQGAVLCFAVLARQGGRARKAKLVITPDHADFPAALEAAKAHLQARLSPDLYEEAIARLQAPQEIPETVPAPQEIPETAQAAPERPQAAPERPQEPQAVQEQETAREPQEAVQATQGPRKASAGSKDFVGTEIRGAGWLIRFDEDLQRTRVIFPDAAPSPAVQAAVEQAGFYFSRAMGSWNKKLTTKAHRAALALAEELTRICGAA